MLFVMFTVLMMQLQSFPRLIMVVSVAPLGMIGVVAALLLSGRPMGFVTILGVLALLGMISKNAVILISQIDAERAQGKGPWEAAVDASSSRFRPIMLTAVSTVLGMIPIAPTVFWGPMAICDHGRPAGGDRFDAGVPADPVCDVVRGQGSTGSVVWRVSALFLAGESRASIR